MLLTLEIIVFLTTTALAILWVRDPGGNYEPWTVLCGVVAAGIDIYRRKQIRSEGSSKKVSKPEEFVRYIQDNGIETPLSHILPRALQLAQLIGDQDLEHWVRMELHGYTKEGGMTEQDIVPEYREVTGRYMDKYDRILDIDDPSFDFVNGYRFRYGVRQLEELAKKTKMQNFRDEEFIKALSKELNVDVYRFCVNPIEMVGVLDRIRNRLLEKVNRIELNFDTQNRTKPAI